MNQQFQISFHNVNKFYGSIKALQGLNFTIPSQKIFVIVGPSGSGKTTLLKMINHLIVPTSGNIKINDRPLTTYSLRQLRLQMGYVIQNIALFPNLTIYQNIGIQLKALHKSKKERLKIAQKLMQEADIDPDKYGERYPQELSGGEQQRVGIIRALAINPKIILMDEPFSALDPIIKNQLQNLVLQFHQQFKTTIVFITHDMNEALKMGDQIAVIHNGKIAQIDAPNTLLQHPKHPIVKALFKSQTKQMVYHLIENHHANKLNINTAKELPEISFRSSIKLLASKLQSHSAVKVEFKNQLWQITPHDLIDFIANGKDE